ncbi:hypothetical protein F4809DRAFT_371347 [Biscogniauxia mediterranea]|nr:hypothetical protein F4809DRAFT_371347 [Biscogniauxia mediterranea]
MQAPIRSTFICTTAPHLSLPRCQHLSPRPDSNPPRGTLAHANLASFGPLISHRFIGDLHACYDYNAGICTCSGAPRPGRGRLETEETGKRKGRRNKKENLAEQGKCRCCREDHPPAYSHSHITGLDLFNIESSVGRSEAAAHPTTCLNSHFPDLSFAQVDKLVKSITQTAIHHHTSQRETMFGSIFVSRAFITSQTYPSNLGVYLS